MLLKIIVSLTVVLSIPVGLLIGALVQNDLPLLDPPGFKKRLAVYFKTNIAETTENSIFPELRPRSYTETIQKLDEAIQQTVIALGWDIIEKDTTEHSLHALVTTPLWKYKDDITIRLTPQTNNATSVYVRSQSRTGKGDLGTNTRHVMDFYQALEKQLQYKKSG